MKAWTRRRYVGLAVLALLITAVAAALPAVLDVSELARVLLLGFAAAGLCGTFAFAGAALHAPARRGE